MLPVTRQLIQKAQGIVLVFDLNFRKSFANLKLWMKVIKEVNPFASVILIGNKSDLLNLESVTK